MNIEAETIHELEVIEAALIALVEKGYSKLSLSKSSDTDALQTAIEWDKKINTAKAMLADITQRF